MTITNESFICQNCKTPLESKALILWVKLGQAPTCKECGDTHFDYFRPLPFYSSIPLET